MWVTNIMALHTCFPYLARVNRNSPRDILPVQFCLVLQDTLASTGILLYNYKHAVSLGFLKTHCMHCGCDHSPLGDSGERVALQW